MSTPATSNSPTSACHDDVAAFDVNRRTLEGCPSQEGHHEARSQRSPDRPPGLPSAVLGRSTTPSSRYPGERKPLATRGGGVVNPKFKIEKEKELTMQYVKMWVELRFPEHGELRENGT